MDVRSYKSYFKRCQFCAENSGHHIEQFHLRCSNDLLSVAFTSLKVCYHKKVADIQYKFGKDLNIFILFTKRLEDRLHPV